MLLELLICALAHHILNVKDDVIKGLRDQLKTQKTQTDEYMQLLEVRAMELVMEWLSSVRTHSAQALIISLIAYACYITY